jgi:hypothetical protein
MNSQLGANAPAIIRIIDAPNQPIRLEPIDELGDVRADAAESRREVAQRDGFTRFCKSGKRTLLGHGQSDPVERCLELSFNRVSGVKKGEGKVLLARGLDCSISLIHR